MKTERQRKKEEEANLVEIVKRICETSFFPDWAVGREIGNGRIVSLTFRIDSALSLATLQRLSDALGTTAINFNFGDSGEPGYGEYTPSTRGHPGWIEVLFPEAP